MGGKGCDVGIVVEAVFSKDTMKNWVNTAMGRK